MRLGFSNGSQLNPSLEGGVKKKKGKESKKKKNKQQTLRKSGGHRPSIKTAVVVLSSSQIFDRWNASKERRMIFFVFFCI
jgi:hypothetical protein